MSVKADDPTYQNALVQARLQTHAMATPSTMLGTLVAGFVALWGIWAGIPSPNLGLGWLTALILALATRMGVRAHAVRQPADANPLKTLARYRAAFGLHGLVWAGLPFLVASPPSPESQITIAFVASAMVGASLVSAAFDLRAALMFSLPLMLSALLMLARDGDDQAHHLALVCLMFFAIVGLSALRSAAVMKAAVRSGLQVQDHVQQSERLAAEAEQARRALADKHALMQQLLRTTRQGYWYVGTDGRTLEVNEAMCEILGRAEAEVRSLGVFDIFQGEERAVLEREIALRRSGRRGSYEVDVVRPDGSRVPCLNTATPIVDDNGHTVGSIGLWTDLTLLKHRERELMTYALAINAMGEPVCVIDETQHYLLVNEAWSSLTGLSRDAVLGRSTAQAPQDLSTGPEGQAAIAACLQQGQERTVRATLMDAQGRKRTLETRYRPFSAGGAEVKGVIMISRDISEQEQAQAAIEAGAEYLRRTLNATGDGIFASDASDPHEPVRFVNDQMLRLWNIPLERASTLTPAEIMAASLPQMQDPERERERIADIVSHNRPDQSQVLLRDGRILFRRCEPARIGSRQLRVWSFRDITAEQRALALLHGRDAEQQALLAAFPGFIARLDTGLRFSYVSPRLAELLGSTPKDLLGRRLTQVASNAVGDWREEQVQQVLAGEQVVFEERIRTPQGLRHSQVTLAAGTDPVTGAPAIYAFGIDITERKRVERQLAAARDEAERANRAKSQFLSHMSHELRTPMNAIAGFTQLLMRDRRSDLTPLQRDWTAQIRLAADHLLELINDILDLGRIEAGQLPVDLRSTPLLPVVRECLALTSALAQARGIECQLEESGASGRSEPRVMADRTRLKQVLLNLLSNAIKFNRLDGRVTLRIASGPTHTQISVIDTGPGLSEAARARLFVPFERLDADKTGVQGTGIGLALCRHLVQAMGGEIGVDSEPGVGSRFWISVPHGGHSTQSAALGDTRGLSLGAPLDRPPGDQSTVLYIDDSPVNVMLMELMIENLPGVRCLSTQLPEEALERARECRPDLILLDLHMPRLSGFEVLRLLKADASLAPIPVVAVSASAMPADIEAALEAGFADYLTKPLDLDQALSVIRAQLEHSPASR